MSDDLVKRLRRYTGLSAFTQEPVQNKLNVAAAARIEELEAKLAKIEGLMVRQVKFAERSKTTAGSESSKRREHYRMHALSEALGEIRKVLKGQDDE